MILLCCKKELFFHKTRSYAAATPYNLYKHLQNSTDKWGKLQINVSISDVMESWINQPGYPLVTVMWNYEMQTFTVSQERLCWRQRQSIFEWWIPLSFTTETITNFSDTTATYWLKPEDESLIMPFHVSSDDWIIFNIQHIWYYRVNYDEDNWRMITYYLNSKHFQKIRRVNRAALIDDAFNQSRLFGLLKSI